MTDRMGICAAYLARLGQEMALAQLAEVIGVGDDVQAAGKSGVNLTGPQCRASRVHGGQPAGASRIHVEARPAELEEVLDAAVGKGSLATGHRVRADVLAAVLYAS